MTTRGLLRSDIEQIWRADRREIRENIYYLDRGKLISKPEYYDMQSWAGPLSPLISSSTTWRSDIVGAETSLIPHGKVLSPLDYTLTLPDLPNPPNPKCPASGVHSKKWPP